MEFHIKLPPKFESCFIKKEFKLPIRFVKITIVLFLILIVIAYILANIKNLTEHFKLTEYDEFLVGSRKKTAKIDCDLHQVYSSYDDQCNQLCMTAHNKTFRVNNGVCVNNWIFEKGTSQTNKCDPHLGVVAYVAGDPQMGNVVAICSSIDPGIRSNDLTKPNKICINGKIDIDYMNNFPQIKNCVCENDRFLALIPQTSQIREHAACVDKRYEGFYNKAHLKVQLNN